MYDTTQNNFVYRSKYSETTSTANPSVVSSTSNEAQVLNTTVSETEAIREESSIEMIARWFLNKSSMSNKKLQKICYYAYAWFIEFYNDLEDCTKEDEASINSICSDSFQAWIHGPVCPNLYRKYKEYGWLDIPKSDTKPNVKEDLEDFLQQVWDAYGCYSADELEDISHSEDPWILARKGLPAGEACVNDISKYDILEYYSKL